MSEMLANQYFMARKYLEAEIEFEEVLHKDPFNKAALKKIVICYTLNNKIEQALSILLHIISDDIKYIIDTDPIQDDCPCHELINEVEEKKLYNNQLAKQKLMFGIFWLYCNYELSLSYLIEASVYDSNNEILQRTINIIQNYSSNKKKEKSF